MIQERPIFYIFFPDNAFVPIHGAEVISEMNRQNIQLHLFTHSVVKKNFTSSTEFAGIRINALWSPKIRFISEIIFMLLLIPYLLVFCLKYKPRALYVRHSAVSIIGAGIARLVRSTCLIEVNDILTDKLLFSKHSVFKNIWISLYTAISFRMAHVLLPVTPQIGEWIHTKYNINKKRIHAIPNGVNVRRFSPQPQEQARLRFSIDRDAKVILSLGSLFPWSGLETLILAAPQILSHHPRSLFVIGSGEEPYLSHIKQLAKQNKVEPYFRFYGFIPWDEAAWFISTADVCVAPFIFKNVRSAASSLRVLSYLSCGRAVVGSNIPGNGDMLQENSVGLSFPMENHEAFAQSINSLLSDTSQLKAFESRARTFVLKSCSWEVIVKKILSCITDA